MAIIKPLIQKLWASGGAVVQPSDTKIETGWTAEVPPHQWENWIQNRQDQYLAHINERGIPEWDGNTDYLASGKSYTQGSDGVVYKSVASSGPATVVQDPTTDVTNTYWTPSFSDPSANYTKAESDDKYLQKSSNLSDVASSTTAFNNIKQNATEAATGVVRIATQAEVNAGALDTVSVTPSKLRLGFSISLASNGYISFPTWMGGLILQWCVGAEDPAGGDETTQTVSFPIPFPTQVLSVMVTTNVAVADIDNDWWYQTVGTPTLSGQVVQRQRQGAPAEPTSTSSPFIFAIGN